MDCRSFKKKHDAFRDDTLPGIETAAMREHLQACARCARHDAEIRRSLLLLRNLPPLEVSSGFTERLRARIADERERLPVPALLPSLHARGPTVGTFLSVVCSVIAVGVLTLAVASRNTPPAASYMFRAEQPTAVAKIVEDPPAEGSPTLVDTNVSAPAYVASMSTGMPVWPALLLAEEGSLRFATAEIRPVSNKATPEP